VMITSEDGLSFSPKRVVLKPADYPDTCTNHVRDPKVWEQDGVLRMLLGTRERDAAAGNEKSADERHDSGAVLIYDSSDCGKSWTLHSVIRGANALGHREAFGYMWECPFLVQLDDQEFLSVCPQGLSEGAGTGPSAGTESSIGASKGSRLNDSANLQESASGEPLDKWQNIWQSGYFPLSEGQKLINVETVSTDSFVLWDHGFDFYAPQTFVDNSGRTILIGWMGIIDPTYHSYPEGIGFCHNLTLPRELSLSGDGVILQRPVKKLDAKRRECVEFVADTVVKIDRLSADIEITGISGDGTLTLNDALELSYSKGIFALKFIDEDIAAGRTQRSIRLKELFDLRVIVDGSTVEIYLNDGRAVFSTRWFPASERLTLSSTFVAASSREYSLIA
ncbi:MAG: GH32 C-terminal domain-containing protein, partial [Atopobium sp.]|nr:GH32 C-terminal domain-containing protein [Atopobium sp.]